MATSGCHVVISVPSGYHSRELLIPLHDELQRDSTIARVTVLTPAAAYRSQLFPSYGPKFDFVANPPTREGYEQLLQKLQPSIVVTPTSGLDELDTPLLEAAAHVGIPSLTFIASWDNVYKMERFKEFGKPYALANHLVVWNTMMAEHLRRVFPQITEQQVSIIGAPRLDFFAHTARIPTKAQLLTYLGLPDDGSKLLHIATTELYPMEYIVRTIREASQNGKLPARLHLYASVHPGGDMRKHTDYARKYNVVVRFSFGRQATAPHPQFLYNPSLEDIYMLVALFKYTDVLVNHSSTVAIESILANVPVVNVKYGQPLDWWRWYRSMVYRDFQQHYADITNGGGTTIVTNPRQLIAAISSYLATPEHKASERLATVRKMITTTDGTAGHQLIDKIKEIAFTRTQKP